MLYPSTYFCATHFGTHLDSIPTKPLNRRNDNEILGLDESEEHAKVLFRNHNLAAANNQINQSILFDMIFNGRLSQSFTNQLLLDGLTELNIKFIDDCASLLWETFQSQRPFRELSASFRKNSTKLFVTLTCNMEESFWVRNVFNAPINNYF